MKKKWNIKNFKFFPSANLIYLPYCTQFSNGSNGETR